MLISLPNGQFEIRGGGDAIVVVIIPTHLAPRAVYPATIERVRTVEPIKTLAATNASGSDLRAFLAKHAEAGSDSRLFLATAFFLVGRGTHPIAAREIRDALQGAGIRRISNPAKQLGRLVTRGHVIRVGRGLFRLTDKGRALIASAPTQARKYRRAERDARSGALPTHPL